MWSLIARRGIEGVSLRTVAAEAGVSVGRIQHYFATKDALLQHSCAVILADAGAAFGAQVRALTPAQTLSALVLRAVPTTEGFAVGTVVWSAFVLKSRDDEVIAAHVRRAHDEGVAVAADCIDRGRALGELAPGPPADELALRLLATAEGYALRVLAGSLPAQAALRALRAELAGLRV